MVAKRKAAGTLQIRARGVAAHSGAAPERGRNALLALGQAAREVAAQSDPDGPDRLTAVPTVIRSGEAFNVVPAAGELICDLRADSLEAFNPVLASVRSERDGVELEAALVRRWPGMDTRSAAGPLLSAAQTSSAGRSAPPSGAVPATRATSPPTSRSPSTGSARSEAPRTTPTSTCSPTRFTRGPRSPSRWSQPRSLNGA